jgi:Tfp pilus assembly protein PilO
MKLNNPKSRLIIAILAVAALALAFWVLALSPKRDEAKKLGTQVELLEASLAQHQAEVVEGEEARGEFAANYRQLVVLGKAVPGDDDTASLLVQLNRISRAAGAKFKVFTLSAEGSAEEAPAPVTTTSEGGTPVSTPTEAVAATMPLGARIGPAGLAVMPYELTFTGNFFAVADFIEGLDSLVKTNNANVAVSGRLLTIDGFALSGANKGFPQLAASFSVTSYLTPPEQGVTAGATATSPPAAAPVSTTIGGTP